MLSKRVAWLRVVTAFALVAWLRVPVVVGMDIAVEGEGDWDKLFEWVENEPSEGAAWVAARRAEGWERDAERAVRLRLVEGQVALMRGENEAAVEHIKAALAAAVDAGDRLGQLRAQAFLAGAYFRQRDYEAAGQNAAAVLTGLAQKEPWRTDSSERLRASALVVKGSIAAMRSELGVAGEHYYTALRTLEALGDTGRATKVRLNLASVEMLSGNLEGARAALEAARDYGEASGDMQVVLVARNNLGAIYEQTGDLAAEIENYEEILRLARAQELLHMVPTVLINLGDAHLRKKDWGQVIAYAEAAAELAREADDLNVYAIAQVNYGLALQGQGDLLGALEHLEAAAESMETLQANVQLEELYWLISDVLAQLGRSERALAYARKGAEIAEANRSSASQARLSELQTQYDKERKEREIAELRQRNLSTEFALERQALEAKTRAMEVAYKDHQLRREEQLRVVLIGGLGLVLILVVLLTRRYRDVAKAKAQMEVVNSALQQREVALQDKNAQLRKVIQDKDEVLGIVAHDLRDPLTSIQGMADYLRSAPESEIREHIGDISDAVEHMDAVVQKLLTAYREDAQSSEQTLDIAALVREVGGRWQARAEAKGQQMDIVVDEAAVNVRGDRTWMVQILDNLLSNAVKYTPRGGEIRVRLWVQAGSAQLAVTDSGPGISDEERGRLFQKFGHTGAVPTGGEESVGLGLSIVRRFVDAQGGRVWCESVAGEGATFRVEFPLEERA